MDVSCAMPHAMPWGALLLVDAAGVRRAWGCGVVSCVCAFCWLMPPGLPSSSFYCKGHLFALVPICPLPFHPAPALACCGLSMVALPTPRDAP